MMFTRRSFAAMAAVTAALAVAVPAANAGAAVAPAPLSPAAMAQTCQIMGFQGQLMSVFANPVYANASSQLATMNGCG
jgi:hypothetical protein